MKSIVYNGSTSSQCPVALIDVHGEKIQTQKGLDYKKIDYKICYFGSTALGLGLGFEWWLCYFLLSLLLLHCYALCLST